MRRYSTICPYSSEACTAMYAACVQRGDGMVAPDGARLPTQVHAGDLDDGLPSGFLTGSVAEVRVALRLNWA
jgi:hypothetical protein